MDIQRAYKMEKCLIKSNSFVDNCKMGFQQLDIKLVY
jgi:hypothetical protein